MTKIQIEGHLTGPEDEDTGLWKWLAWNEKSLAELLISKLDWKRDWTTYDYGRCRITIEQLDTPEAMAKRVVERHRGTLDMLGEADEEAWTPPTALVVFPKDLEMARAILRAAFEEHGVPWDDSMYRGQGEIDTEEIG